MSIKKSKRYLVWLCVAALLATALCGCDDLGAYVDDADYYSTFGNVIMIGGEEGNRESYSVEEYFFNRETRDDFLRNDDGTYGTVPIDDYMYMVVPVLQTVEIDTIALYVLGGGTGTVGINLYVMAPDENGNILERPRIIGAPDTEKVEEDGVTVDKTIEYDDPDPSTAVGNAVVRVDGEKWGSFMIDSFNGGGASNSFTVEAGKYIVIQFKNNSGAIMGDNENDRTEITVTNLLVRALSVDGKAEG